MDKKKETAISVHRCRFVDFAPSAITALAYPPPPLPSIIGKRKAPNGPRQHKFGVLAVGHANGNIDLCEWMGNERDIQCPQAWVTRKTLSGPYPSKVDSLVFIIRHPDELESGEVPQLSQLRLFSSGGGSELVEWDLQRGCIRQTISSQGGSIWSIAANPSCTSLALGCEDGTVRIITVANDTYTHSRRFDRVKCRMLSVAWGPPIPKKPTQKPNSANADDSSDDEDDEDEWTDSWIVTGGSDSSLRKWDVATGSVMDRMGVDKVRGERTLVWTVGVLGDGTIVSGDSLGSVKFWDSRTCTQLYSFQAHGADVLCMTISPDGKQLYTAGVDQKTVQFSFVKTSSASIWTQTTSKRMHSHDVRALAIWPPYAPLPTTTYRSPYPLDIAPILTSGGLDMSVVLTPAAPPSSTLAKVMNPLDTSVEATFEDSYHRKLSYVGRGRVKVARSARLVSCAREAGVSVWRIHKRRKVDMPLDAEGEEDEDLEAVYGKVDVEPAGPAWEKVLEMDLKVHSNIVAHEISDNGKWLMVSDLYESKLFSMRTDDNGQISIKRIKDFSSILQAQIPSSKAHPNSTGGSAFQFTPDSSKLVLATSLSSYILVIDLTGEKPRILRRFDHHRSQDSIVRNRVITGKIISPRKPTSAPKVNGVVNGDVDMSEPAINGVTGSESDEEAESGMDENEDSSSDEEDTGVFSEPTAIVSIDRMVISTDGQWLATSDNQARTHIFNLDSISHHTILPSFPTPIQTLSFDPQHPSVLLLVFANNTIQIYDVESKHFPAWGKDLAYSLPKKFTSNHEVVLGVMWDPYVPTGPSDTVQGEKRAEGDGQTRYILFWGSTWLFKIALETTRRTGGFVSSKKRRRDAGSRLLTGANAAEGAAQSEDNPTDMYASMRDTKMITQYRPILCCDFLSKDELVVVERPLVDVLLTLPPAYFKPKYGAS